MWANRWVRGIQQNETSERKTCENKSSSCVPKKKLLWRHYFPHDSCKRFSLSDFLWATASVCVSAFVFILVCFFVSDVLIHSFGLRNWCVSIDVHIAQNLKHKRVILCIFCFLSCVTLPMLRSVCGARWAEVGRDNEKQNKKSVDAARPLKLRNRMASNAL